MATPQKIDYNLPYSVVLSIKWDNVYKLLRQWLVSENEQQMSPPLIISNKDNDYSLTKTFDGSMNNCIFSRKNVSKKSQHYSSPLTQRSCFQKLISNKL